MQSELSEIFVVFFFLFLFCFFFFFLFFYFSNSENGDRTASHRASFNQTNATP